MIAHLYYYLVNSNNNQSKFPHSHKTHQHIPYNPTHISPLQRRRTRRKRTKTTTAAAATSLATGGGRGTGGRNLGVAVVVAAGVARGDSDTIATTGVATCLEADMCREDSVIEDHSCIGIMYVEFNILFCINFCVYCMYF